MFPNKYIIDNKSYNIGISIRLSREDGDDIESESISNQKLMLLNFVQNLGPNFKLIDIYIDDGFSGLNFNRPGFKKMIRDIENKKINMVITKDLSRLGRDYIETGFYIEKYFPEHNIRFIALNDNIDTFNEKCEGSDLMPFRLGMNDMYAKDISKKVRTNLLAMKNAGLFASSTAPYGYMKDPTNKHKLIPDQETAPIIKRIFNLYISGYSTKSIAELLTKEEIPTPIMQKKMISRMQQSNHPEIWKYSSIINILKNKVYLGTLIQHTSQNINYKTKKKRKVPESEWIVKENAHEALIDKQTFELANQIRNKSNIYSPNRRNIEYVLSNIVYCKDCGAKMTISYDKKRNRTIMNCNTYRKFSKYNFCSSHFINYDKLEKSVFNKIKILNKNLNSQEFINYLSQLKNDPLAPLNKVINETKLKIKKLEIRADNLYYDKEKNIINVEQFKRISISTEKEINHLKNKLKKYNKERKCIINNIDETINYQHIINNFLSMENPTKEMINKLIKKIYISKNKKIEIHYNFKNMDVFLNQMVSLK